MSAKALIVALFFCYVGCTGEVVSLHKCTSEATDCVVSQTASLEWTKQCLSRGHLFQDCWHEARKLFCRETYKACQKGQK
jgi:hypothetical protein